jgi:hypothetical protein
VIGAFSYHKAIAPMIWVLIGLSSIELVVEHLLLAHWMPQLAIVLGIMTVATILWLVMVLRSFRVFPVLVDDDGVVMRLGRLREVRLAPDQILRLARTWDAETIKQRHVLNLALLAYPNVLVDLVSPVRVGRRRIQAIAHRLDDPDGFAAALNRLGPRA